MRFTPPPEVELFHRVLNRAQWSGSCKQKTSGLRWMSLHLLVPILWTRRVWALPVLTALCPSERYPHRL